MNLFRQGYLISGLLLILALVSGCSQNETNFTQVPGFKQYFADNKPSTTLPSQAEQALLERFKPRVFMATGQTRFINFYDDYIANGSLYIDDELISDSVDQALLNQYKNDIGAEFRYEGTKQTGMPTVYARIQRDTLSYKNQNIPLTFLSYNLVFANSGLLKGLDNWQRIAMNVVGSTTDWHQLDHYVGLTIALSDDKPIAVTLQQHNYQTTWLLAEKASEDTLILPADSRVSVDVAMQSNELYPHTTALKNHPGLSWVSEDSIEFLKTGQNKPMMAGFDITHGEEEQEYTLAYLPTADAFYTFQGRLGEGRKLPGRDGPPGADYVTLPALMPLANRLVSGYRPRDTATEKSKITALFAGGSFSINAEGLDAYKNDFIKDLQTHSTVSNVYKEPASKK